MQKPEDMELYPPEEPETSEYLEQDRLGIMRCCIRQRGPCAHGLKVLDQEARRPQL